MFRLIARVLPFLLVGLAALLTCSCTRSFGAPPTASQAADVPTVAVAKAASENLSRDLVLTAEFKPYQEVDVMAKVAGYIKEIRVDVGDRVKEGDVLATLEIPEMIDDLNHSRASIRHSEAEVKRAQDEVKRAQSVHDGTHALYTRLAAVSEKRPGLIAQQDIDEAQSRDLAAEAQISVAISALAAARQQVEMDNSARDRVQTLMDYRRVTAPFTGVVTKRFADSGSMIQAGTASQTQAMPVVRLSQNQLLRLILPVPESAVSTVHIGQRVTVRVPTLNRGFTGSVARFADKLAMETRTMDTEVDVPNSDLLLIPGMYAEVDLTLARHDGVVAIPVMAVDPAGAGAGEIMVITPNRRVELRRVALGLETADRVEISSGLNAGDLVVLSGRSRLKPGQEVRPKLTAMAAAGS
jgi:RND family efflux transporter MFP subunit